MVGKYNEINLCEVCSNTNLISVLNLGMHPMCDDLVLLGDKRLCNEYPIEILFCQKCNTAHQRFQIPKEELFPSTYHYRSRFTADVLNGMESLVKSCSKHLNDLTNKKVLDIGCNDGSLLDFFKKEGAITFGIEPTNAYLDAEEKGHIIYNNFLSEAIVRSFIQDHGHPDLITFTNVFAHIENLDEVLCALKKLMNKKTFIVIENHYLGSVLGRNQFDTFYHEHPRTYSFASFVRMAKTLNTELIDVEFPSRYGGNIRIFLGKDSNVISSTNLNELYIKENAFFSNFITLGNNVDRWQKSKKQFLIEQYEKYGKLRAKAFPGRAAILVKLLELDENLISAVYEKPGSLKIGNYLPGTRIPILSDNELFSDEDQSLPLLNLAWHIPLEIRAYLTEKNYKGKIFDILSLNDFV
ncbi:class I SAM-dependent methyltransferase [Candidatus Methylopumilus planktonicus]|uniref:class I SAM-dependent methyltransferase n=1 Tax=Candidatus Methylopumilus planktonicus TaxID=1581557 RepID=UPI003D18F3E6